MAKPGRPTDSPKTYRRSFRLSEEDVKRLDYCVSKGYTMTDVIRKGIEIVFSELRRKRYEDAIKEWIQNEQNKKE